MTVTKRDFLTMLAASAATAVVGLSSAWAKSIQKLVLSETEWRKRLSPDRFQILRKEGTERRYSSPLNKEQRNGTYNCSGCDLTLFNSDTKYDSRTGWPSFFKVIPGRVGTRKDTSFGFVRLEYHCARCGGHQGHLFNDGPRPTGLRYCNNGLALRFKPRTS